MKKIILLFLVILLVAFFIYGREAIKKSNEIKSKYKDFTIIKHKLENKEYTLLLADSPEEQEKGLMNFRNLAGVDGMLFTFPDKQIRHFWNKNTLLDLELLWIDGDKIVGRSKLPSIEKSKEIITVSSPVAVDKVIELPL